MTQEERLKEAKRLYETANADQRYVLESLFPELKESEKEQNIKNLIDELKCSLRNANCQNDACGGGHEKRIALLEWSIAWLEKQGENSPILYDSSNIGKNWSEEDDKIRKVLIDLVKNNGSYYYLNTIPKDDIFAWLESKSAPEAINEPVDKVEPKFKVGDWVMNKSGQAFSNGSISACVQRIEGHKVWFEHGTYADEWVLKKITD